MNVSMVSYSLDERKVLVIVVKDVMLLVFVVMNMSVVSYSCNERECG